MANLGGDSHIMPLNICEFHENQLTENHILLLGHKLFFAHIFSIFLSSLHKNEYRRCPQKFIA